MQSRHSYTQASNYHPLFFTKCLAYIFVSKQAQNIHRYTHKYTNSYTHKHTYRYALKHWNRWDRSKKFKQSQQRTSLELSNDFYQNKNCSLANFPTLSKNKTHHNRASCSIHLFLSAAPPQTVNLIVVLHWLRVFVSAHSCVWTRVLKQQTKYGCVGPILPWHWPSEGRIKFDAVSTGVLQIPDAWSRCLRLYLEPIGDGVVFAEK